MMNTRISNVKSTIKDKLSEDYFEFVMRFKNEFNNYIDDEIEENINYELTTSQYITMKTIKKHPEIRWEYYCLSENKNITINDFLENQNEEWELGLLIRNGNFSSKELVMLFDMYPHYVTINGLYYMDIYDIIENKNNYDKYVNTNIVLSKHKQLTIKIIREHPEINFDFDFVSCNKKISFEDIDNNLDLNWNFNSMRLYNMPEWFIEKHLDKLSLEILYEILNINTNISFEFIKKTHEKKFLRTFIPLKSLYNYIKNNYIKAEHVEYLMNHPYMEGSNLFIHLCSKSELTVENIEKYFLISDYGAYLSDNDTLTENIILHFKDKIKWRWANIFSNIKNKVSFDFIFKHYPNLLKGKIYTYRNVPMNILIQNIENINLKYLTHKIDNFETYNMIISIIKEKNIDINELDWEYLTTRTFISEEYIIENNNYPWVWFCLQHNSSLSEDFMFNYIRNNVIHINIDEQIIDEFCYIPYHGFRYKKRFNEEIKKHLMATRIQRYWRKCLYDPQYKMCRLVFHKRMYLDYKSCGMEYQLDEETIKDIGDWWKC
jgi:hypothetical protein